MGGGVVAPLCLGVRVRDIGPTVGSVHPGIGLLKPNLCGFGWVWRMVGNLSVRP